MKKIIKVIFIIFSFMMGLIIFIKGWFIYQHVYVCEPKVRIAVEKFLKEVITHEYETLNDNTMFINKEQFIEVKFKVSNNYSLEIKDWGGDGTAYTIIQFDNKAIYALLLVPNRLAIPTCWGVEYKVLTIRR